MAGRDLLFRTLRLAAVLLPCIVAGCVAAPEESKPAPAEPEAKPIVSVDGNVVAKQAS